MTSLTPQQQVGLDRFEDFLFAEKDREFILSGFSGCGKTHLTEAMIGSVQKYLKSCALIGVNTDITYELTATTNQAAKVLSDRLKMPINTIYSALKVKLCENYRTGKEELDFSNCSINYDKIIYFIDEASYLSDEMIMAIRDYRPNSKFVYIGDKFQLPPVGYNTAPAFDIACPQYHLSDIIRQPSQTLKDLVIKLKDDVETNRFNFSLHPLHNGQDLIICNGSDFQALIDAEFTRTDYEEDDAKILAYHNHTVTAYSHYVRELLGKPEIFIQGDRAILGTQWQDIPTGTEIILGNVKRCKADQYNLETYQIDINGYPAYYTPDFDGKQALLKSYAWEASRQYRHWSEYFELKNFFIDLRDPSASTVHKAQGSTHKTIFVDLHDLNACKSKSLLRRLRYVGLSRGSERVIVYAK